jgi:hypothetical protein
MTLPEKIKIIGLVLFFSLFVGYYTLASDVDTGLIGNYACATNNLLWSDGIHAWGQRFVANQANISAIQLLAFAGSASSTISVSICRGIPNNTSLADVNANVMACNWSGNELLWNGVIVPDDYDSNSNFVGLYNWLQLPTPVELTVGDNYYYAVSIGDGTYNNTYKSCNSGSWTGRIVDNRQWPESATSKIFYDDTWTPPPVYVDLIFPEHPLDGETVFSNDGSVDFIGTYQNYLGVLFEITVYPQEGLPIVYTRPELQTNLYPVPYDIPIPLLPGDYSYMIQTRMANDSIATTTFDRGLINFTFSDYRIPTSTAQFAMPNGLSVETVCDGIATSTIMGGIECGFKRVIYWAFYPSNNALLSLQSSITNLKASFPFSAFFDLTDTIDTAIATSTTNMAGTIDMPFINGSGDYIMLPVMASSSLSNLIGSTNATLFRNSLTWFLWACAGVLVFLTFKKL